MLELSHVSKTFNAGTVNEKRALCDLSLTLADGEFATIVGSNGAGKSTLFNAIAGMFYVDDGILRLDGRDITFLPPHKRSRRIGHLFQDPLKGTAPHMTIEENLAVAYLRAPEKHKQLRRVSRKDREFFRDALAQLDMGLEERMNTPVGLLSGGQRQALTLLMATMVTPELLLLDEHTAALDPVTAEDVYKRQLLDREPARRRQVPGLRPRGALCRGGSVLLPPVEICRAGARAAAQRHVPGAVSYTHLVGRRAELAAVNVAEHPLGDGGGVERDHARALDDEDGAVRLVDLDAAGGEDVYKRQPSEAEAFRNTDLNKPILTGKDRDSSK